MSRVFLPSCKLQARWKEPSAKLLTYLQEKQQVKKIGCCKAFCEKVSPKDQAIVVCNNCAAIMEESSPIRDIEFAWEIIDRDELVACITPVCTVPNMCVCEEPDTSRRPIRTSGPRFIALPLLDSKRC